MAYFRTVAGRRGASGCRLVRILAADIAGPTDLALLWNPALIRLKGAEDAAGRLEGRHAAGKGGHEGRLADLVPGGAVLHGPHRGPLDPPPVRSSRRGHADQDEESRVQIEV